jgi:hypothetical protein
MHIEPYLRKVDRREDEARFHKPDFAWRSWPGTFWAVAR